jgi:hypothetical protein
MDHQEKQDAASKSDSQPYDIDRGVQLVLEQVAKGSQEIATKHVVSFPFRRKETTILVVV